MKIKMHKIKRTFLIDQFREASSILIRGNADYTRILLAALSLAIARANEALE